MKDKLGVVGEWGVAVLTNAPKRDSVRRQNIFRVASLRSRHLRLGLSDYFGSEMPGQMGNE